MKLIYWILLTWLALLAPAQAANIVQIAMSSENIPFLLDDKGQVWAFQDPLHVDKPIKLPNLINIKSIAPYMALDAHGQVFTWNLNLVESGSDQGELNDAVYTPPQKVEGLQGVTLIASSDEHHFAAVIGDKEIVHWRTTLHSSGAATNNSILVVASRAKVKGLSFTNSRLAALFDDGAILAWKTKILGAPNDNDWESVLQIQSPEAKTVAISSTHIVALLENGLTRFWGGCDFDGKDIRGKPWTPERIDGAEGLVTGVTEMGINPGNDNAIPDVFIKRDGTVWEAYAPLPKGMTGTSCYRSERDKEQFWQLTAGSAAAVQVIAVGKSILMLDADHKLWTTADSWQNTKFRNAQLNLK